MVWDTMKLGGLFSGIGGFEAAWVAAGGTVAWMCEIEPAARRVLEARFPGVPIYRDVSELDPAEGEPVDMLTGGSPCQGFSIAGARTGLEHVESRLFADYVRIMDGLADRGLSWAVWENVPGVLSISNDDGERTFPHVVAALVGADEPVRLDSRVRWNTGLADRGDRAVAWRVVDSRHFGVPQRRRRVYACVAFGDLAADRAGRAILAKPEGVRGDLAACAQAGQDVAGTLRASLGSGSTGHHWDDASVPDQARTLTAHGQRAAGETETFVPAVARTLKARADSSFTADGHGNDVVAQAFDARQSDVVQYGDKAGPLDTDGHSQAVVLRNREGKDGGGKGPLLSEDESLTLATGNDQILFEPVPFSLRGRDGGAQPEADPDGVMPALRGEGGSSRGYVAMGVSENERAELRLTPYLRSVTSGGEKPGQGYPAALTAYGVRRLTPTESERLQGFPDGWTEPAGSDSARYRALGNAVTVNVPAWLFSRIKSLGVRAAARADTWLENRRELRDAVPSAVSTGALSGEAETYLRQAAPQPDHREVG